MSENKRFKKWHLNEYNIENLTPIKARDLIIECFYETQKELFKKTKEKIGSPSDEEEIHKTVTASIRSIFNKINGDFENPTKESLLMVVAYLAKKAASWNTPQEIIEHNKEQIQEMIDHLP